MDITIIAETQGDNLHPVTSQLVGAATSLGASPTVLCAGGAGADAAAGIAGVGKVLSVVGDCFSTFDGGAWAAAFDAAGWCREARTWPPHHHEQLAHPRDQPYIDHRRRELQAPHPIRGV